MKTEERRREYDEVIQQIHRIKVLQSIIQDLALELMMFMPREQVLDLIKQAKAKKWPRPGYENLVP